MKKFLPLLILIFSFNIVQAQDCRYLVKEVDKFTKSEKLETYPVIVFNYMKRLDLRFIKNADWRYLYAHVTISPINFVVRSDDKMILLFTDNTTYTLNLESDSGNKISAGQLVGAQSVYGLFYPLTDNDLTNLTGKELAGVRIYGAAGYIEFQSAKTAMQFGGAGKAKKEEALKNFFVKDINCIK